MNKFQVTILGCGSAMPSSVHNPPAQLVDMNEKLFLVDCGEGTQLQMKKFRVRMSKLHSVFISHLHGDHIFGLPGLLSTLSMLGRTGDLCIYAHEGISTLINMFLDYMGKRIPFEIKLVPIHPERQELLFENKSIRISTFPLKHRIVSNGFLFEVKESPRHIIRERIDLHQIPLKEISIIKEGADFITPEGDVVPNKLLTSPGTPSCAYAYCSDTAYAPEIVPYIQNVDLLYHEATYAESELIRARETYHSTARQAAEIAKAANAKKLVIGHYSSRYDALEVLLSEAAAVFPATELASEGKIFDVQN